MYFPAISRNFKKGNALGPQDFERNAPGKVVRSVLGNWTFLPEPLPPELAYSAELVQQTAEATQALGELSGAGRMLPNPHLLMRPFLRREAVLSSKIEGTTTAFTARMKSSNCSTRRWKPCRR